MLGADVVHDMLAQGRIGSFSLALDSFRIVLTLELWPGSVIATHIC